MKEVLFIMLLGATTLMGAAQKESEAGDWWKRHPMTEGRKRLNSLTVADGIKLCEGKLAGKDRLAVKEFLGTSERDHGEEEYLYYPEREDGSLWMLMVEFDGNGRAVAIYGNELLPSRPNKKH